MGKRKKSKGGSFLMQGSILAAAGIITKIIGAVYRIPMLNIMGLKGQGYYDMAFQVYSIALIISSYSLPVAVSKLVSLKNGGRRAEKCIQGIEGITDHSYAIWCHDHGDRIFWSRGDRRISDGSQNELLFFEGACSRTPDLCDYGSFSWLFPGDGNDDPDCNFADH